MQRRYGLRFTQRKQNEMKTYYTSLGASWGKYRSIILRERVNK